MIKWCVELVANHAISELLSVCVVRVGGAHMARKSFDLSQQQQQHGSWSVVKPISRTTVDTPGPAARAIHSR